MRTSRKEKTFKGKYKCQHLKSFTKMFLDYSFLENLFLLGGKNTLAWSMPQMPKVCLEKSPPDTLPLTLSHFGFLGWRAVFRFLPADDIFVHGPLPVVGLGHAPRGLLTAAVRHDVHFGRIQRPTNFGTVS